MIFFIYYKRSKRYAKCILKVLIEEMLLFLIGKNQYFRGYIKRNINLY